MRYSSIGSPLLSFIQAGGSRSLPGASSSITTHPAWLDLSVIAPRACQGAIAQASVLGAMVSVFPYPGMLGVLHARTTFLTTNWAGQWRELIEYSRVVDSRVSLLAAKVHQVDRRGGERWFPVWTSPQILQLGPSPKLARWSVGLGRAQFRV